MVTKDNVTYHSRAFPVPNSTIPFWRTKLHPLDEHRSTAKLPEECDVLIIGAGYAGVATAYHLATDKSGISQGEQERSIVLLEARQVCSGATGRNGGHLRPSVGSAPKYVKRYGVEAAAEVVDFELSHIQVFKDLIEKDGIDCDFILTRSLEVYTDENEAITAKAVHDALVDQNLAYMKDVQYTSSTSAEGFTGVKGAKACFSTSAGSIWAYRFVLHLLQRALEHGVNLQTTTPVTDVSSDPDAQGRYAVTTPRGSILARRIVYTTNAYTAGLLPEYKASIIPCKGICCRIVVPNTDTPPLLTNTYMVHVDGVEGSYLIPRADGSIIVGGGYTHRKFQEQWYNTVNDSTTIEASKSYYEGFMQRTFNGWEQSGAYVDRTWTGIMGYSWDTLPHIGRIPAKPNHFIAAGFNGHGMPVIFRAAQGVARMIRTGESFEEVGLPRLYRSTSERLKRAQAGPEEGDILGETCI